VSGFHVLLVHQAFISPDEAGGTRHFELGKHWVRAGNRFTIIASDRSYLTGRRVPGPADTLLEGIRVLRARALPAQQGGFLFRVFSFLVFSCTSFLAGLRVRHVDVVMGTSPPIFQAVAAWALAAIRRRPFLLEVRDLWPEFAIDMGVLRSPLLIRMARRLEAFLYARASHILVNSPAYRDYLLRDKGQPGSKVTLIANGVDASQFDPDDTGASVREEYGLAGRFVVTYAGAMGMANDLDVLVRAAARLRHYSSIRFLLVGDGKERPRLEALARSLECGNITFTGGRPKSRMKDYLAASDACVAILKNVPMFTTTYPNKVFDYMAAGRPVVLAIDGVIRQVVEEAQAGIFVTPGHEAALARAIAALAADPASARAMGVRGRQHVVAHFDRARQAQAFTSLLERLAARP
jgi:glycosyltransferase involved in cell wall biosynthesis